MSLDTLGYIRHYAAPNADNSRLLDVDTAIHEAALYKQHGGDSLVDATSIGIARDPDALARTAARAAETARPVASQLVPAIIGVPNLTPA